MTHTFTAAPHPVNSTAATKSYYPGKKSFLLGSLSIKAPASTCFVKHGLIIQKVHLFQACLLCKACRDSVNVGLCKLICLSQKRPGCAAKQINPGISVVKCHKDPQCRSVGSAAPHCHSGAQTNRNSTIFQLLACKVILAGEESKGRNLPFSKNDTFDITCIQFSSASAVKITFQTLAVKSASRDLF